MKRAICGSGIIPMFVAVMLGLGGCGERDPNMILSPAEVAEFRILSTDTRLPPFASNVRTQSLCGIDCQEWVTFDAPLDSAKRFAEDLVGKKLTQGSPPHFPRFMRNKEGWPSLDWWPKTWPETMIGNETMPDGPPYARVAIIPDGPTGHVFIEAFTT